MRLIYTDQSFESLEESLQFLLHVQKVPLDKVLEIRARLLIKAETLADHPYLGQYEEYLEHLEKGHRRVIEGHFKIIYRVEGGCVFITDFFDSRLAPETMKG